MQVRDIESDWDLILLLKIVRKTDVVELSVALKKSLEYTLELVERLRREEIISMDEYGHVFYIRERPISFSISNILYPFFKDQMLSFIKTFDPANFPKQRNLVQNQLDGILIEWDLVQLFMENESDFFIRWEPEGPVRDIEISYKQGKKMIFIQVKSTRKDKLNIKEKDSKRLVQQYGKKGFFALKIKELPFYFVSGEYLKNSGVRQIDNEVLLSSLSTHYDLSIFKKCIKKCLIP